jgi:hypothetical protein
MKAYFLIFWITCSLLNGQFIELKNTSGTTIEARVLSFQNGKVKLQRNDGITFVASISIFDSQSIAVIKQMAAEISENKKTQTISSGSRVEKSKISFSKMNEAVGQKLFVDTNLWDDTADEVGGRLNWPVESATSNTISCRFYAPLNYRFLGSRPY